MLLASRSNYDSQIALPHCGSVQSHFGVGGSHDFMSMIYTSKSTAFSSLSKAQGLLILKKIKLCIPFVMK